jgi:ribosomal-protein-alanine N-acetyltransferase
MMALFRPRVFVDELRRSEADALAELHSGAFARYWSADDFAALMADGSVFALAARRQPFFGRRRLVGFALVRLAADEAEVLTVAIEAASRGRGYGRLLMEETLRRLYRERIRTCFLEVDRNNTAAVRLYHSLGFEVVGERKGYYRQTEGREGTALVMRVSLG